MSIESKKIMAFLVFVLATFSIAYKYLYIDEVVKINARDKAIFADQFKHDDFDLSGEFEWKFKLGVVNQVSTHNFHEDYIDYRMRGKIYSTDYKMEKLSYDRKNRKWIGLSDDGTVFVIFFKQLGENHITLYKRKCRNGLQEAINLNVPADDATDDHGWNQYTRKGVSPAISLMPISGYFASENNTLLIDDASIELNNEAYQKITHHLGERRWVGEKDGRYLLVFYEMPADNGDVAMSIQTFDDIESAYKAKHNQQTFTAFKQQ